MSAVLNEMPLLPMPAVLFPGTFLPVQIANPAHRRLLRACADENRSLGVLLNAGTDTRGGLPMVPRATGCIGSVALVMESDDKAVVGAVLYGEQRMRVVHYLQQEPFVTGRVEALEDYSGSNAEQRTKQASRLFLRYLELVRQRYRAQAERVPLPDDPIMASYLLAAVLSLPLETKQRWLESSTAALRLQEELAFLRQECDRLATMHALSSQAQVQYVLPDARNFTSLLSEN